MSIAEIVERTKVQHQADARQAYKDLVIQTVETGELPNNWEAVLEAADVSDAEFTSRVELGETIHRERELREELSKRTAPLTEHRTAHAERVKKYEALLVRLKLELSEAETSIAESKRKLDDHASDVSEFARTVPNAIAIQQHKIVPYDFAEEKREVSRLHNEIYRAKEDAKGGHLTRADTEHYGDGREPLEHSEPNTSGPLGSMHTKHKIKDRAWIKDAIRSIEYKLFTTPEADMAGKWHGQVAGLKQEIKKLDAAEADVVQYAEEYEAAVDELREAEAEDRAEVEKLRSDWRVFLFL